VAFDAFRTELCRRGPLPNSDKRIFFDRSVQNDNRHDCILERCAIRLHADAVSQADDSEAEFWTEHSAAASAEECNSKQRIKRRSW